MVSHLINSRPILLFLPIKIKINAPNTRCFPKLLFPPSQNAIRTITNLHQ